MINYKRVQQRANRTALSYEKSHFLQKAMAERLAQRLECIRLQPNRVLDLGAGTGWMAELIKQHYADAQVLSVDFSANRSRCARDYPCVPITADMHALPLQSGSVDLIIANDSLHWVAEPAMVLKECHRVLRAGGLMMLTSLGPDSLQALRDHCQKHSLTAMPHDFMDMHDLGDELAHAGFADPVMDSERLTLRYHSSEQLCRDIQRLGVGSVMAGPQGLMTPRRWQQLWSGYPRDADGKLMIDIELVQGHAWKVEAGPISRLSDRGEVIVPISSIARRG